MTTVTFVQLLVGSSLAVFYIPIGVKVLDIMRLENLWQEKVLLFFVAMGFLTRVALVFCVGYFITGRILT